MATALSAGTCARCNRAFKAGTNIRNYGHAWAHTFCAPNATPRWFPEDTKETRPKTRRPVSRDVVVVDAETDCPICHEAIRPHTPAVRLRSGQAHYQCVVM